MSKYEKMVQAAEEGRENWILRRDSSARFIYQLLKLFMKVCQMPEDRLRILPWDDKAKRFNCGSPEPIEMVLSSTRYDMESDNWQAAIVVYFNPSNYFPRLYVTFVLIVTEHDSKFTAQIGEPGEPQPIDLNVQSQTEQFLETIVEEIKKAMKDPMKSPGRQQRIVVHGFAALASSEQSPENA
jgi:hypothetical protein